MKNFLKKVKARAKANPKRIVFPEGSEPRVIEAAAIIEEEGTAIPILLGDPKENEHFERYADELAMLRKLSPSEATKL